MPISFSQIPEEIQIAIVEKQEAIDLAKFHESSLQCSAVVEKIRKRLILSEEILLCKNEMNEDFTIHSNSEGKLKHRIQPKYLAEVPIRFVAKQLVIHGSLSKELCDWLINLLTDTNSSFSSLCIDSIRCRKKQFNQLFEISKLKEFECSRRIMPVALGVSAMEKIERLKVESPIDDVNIHALHLNMPTLVLNGTHLSSVGINLFLREWIDGERNIERVIISTSEDLDKDLILFGILHSSALKTNKYREICTINRNGDQEISVKIGDNIVDISIVC